MKSLKFFTLFLVILGVAVLVSCNKEDKKIPDDTSVSADDALAESLYDDVANIANDAYENGSDGLKSSTESLYLNGCATVTLDTTVFPRELTIDFGPENCLCRDGRYRRGKILVTFNGRYWRPGTVRTYGFDGYYVNDIGVDGTKVITNMGFNEDGHPYFNIESVGVITRPSGATFSWNSSKVREWIEGYTTRPRLDDVYLITGNSTGIKANGLTWSREIINPLRVEIGCRWIVSGTMEIAPEGLPVRLVDWGSGECDNIITVLVNGNVYTKFLP